MKYFDVLYARRDVLTRVWQVYGVVTVLARSQASAIADANGRLNDGGVRMVEGHFCDFYVVAAGRAGEFDAWHGMRCSEAFRLASTGTCVEYE